MLRPQNVQCMLNTEIFPSISGYLSVFSVPINVTATRTPCLSTLGTKLFIHALVMNAGVFHAVELRVSIAENSKCCFVVAISRACDIFVWRQVKSLERGWAGKSSKGSSSKSSGNGKSSKSSSSKSSGNGNGNSRKWQRLSVGVFCGVPVDAYVYRHTGLLIEHLNNDGTLTRRNFIHLTGSAGFFFQCNESFDRNPAMSRLFAGSVPVATIPASGSSDSCLRNAIWSTAINNASYDWNCQTWVGDALNSCVAAGLISSDEAELTIDGMTELVLQAPALT